MRVTSQDRGETADRNRSQSLLDVFENGPPRRLGTFARLRAPLCPNTAYRVLLVLALGWLPLLALSLAPLLAGHGATTRSFASDIGAHARFAVAAPLFILAYAVSARELGAVGRHFLTAGVVPDRCEADLTSLLEKARHRLVSPWAEAIILLVAYGTVLATLLIEPHLLMQWRWQVTDDVGTLSIAGWWHILVSTPMLLVIVLGWLLRIGIWTDFLLGVSRLPLRLMAAHPDQAGGLGFLAQSVRALAIVGMAFGSISAGRFAYVHHVGIASALTNPLIIGGTLAFVLIICVGPLLIFSPLLTRTWRDGSMAYGPMAMRLGGQLERRWLSKKATDEMLDAPDFSAATDLYQVISNVYAIRFVPVDTRSLLILIGATLFPFLPAMFLSMPTTEVMQELKGLIF